MKIGIIMGPGHHHQMMIDALKSRRIAFRYAKNWPSLKVWDVDESGLEHIIYHSKLYDIICYLVWGIWARLPLPRKKKFHLDLLFPLYDFLVSRFFEDCDKVIGWSQVSLYTMKKVKHKGGKFIIEHPMVHADYWNKTILEENKTFFKNKQKCLSNLWTSYMLRRMRSEYLIADKINLLSSFAIKTFIENDVDKKKLYCTPLGIDTSLFKAQGNENKHESCYIILFVGRIELLKGVHYLIEAFKQLNIRDAELWLVGAIQTEMQHYIKNNISFLNCLGEKSREELAVIYQQADILVFPSLLDAFGLVLIESLASGTPVIASESSGAPDILRGDEGEVVNTKNIQLLEKTLKYYYNLKKEGKSLSIKNQRIKDNYCQEKYFGRLYSLVFDD